MSGAVRAGGVSQSALDLVESGRGARTWVTATAYPQFTIVTDGIQTYRVLVTSYVSGASIAADVTANKLALLPAARGVQPWVAATAYVAGQLMTRNGQNYTRVTAGTSGATFDATEAATWDLFRPLYVGGVNKVVNVECVGDSIMAGMFNYMGRNRDVTVQNLTAGGTSGMDYFTTLAFSGVGGLIRNAGDTPVQISFCKFLLNDIAKYGAITGNLGNEFDYLYRYGISRMRVAPGGWYKVSPTKNAAYAGSGFTAQGVSSSLAYGVTGAYEEWTSPSGWLGGWVCWGLHEAKASCIYELKLNGSVVATADATTWAIGAEHGVRVRVPPGAGQLVRMTATGAFSGFVYHSGLHVEAAIPNMVVMFEQPYSYAYQPTFGTGGVPTAGVWTRIPSDADIDQANARLRTLVAEFDSFVITVPTNGLIDKQPVRAGPDVHPTSPEGVGLMVGAGWKAVQNAAVVSDVLLNP